MSIFKEKKPETTLDIPPIMHEIFVNILKDVYDRGFHDGVAEEHNELIHEEPKLDIVGMENVLQDVLKKYYCNYQRFKISKQI